MAKGNKRRFTASHIMLYVILGVYISVVVCGILLIKHFAEIGDAEACKMIFTALASMTAVCGSVTAGFYATKASRENVLQINNHKYKMRLKLAKDIYKTCSDGKLDEKSLQLMRTLISDDGIAQEQITTTVQTPSIDIPTFTSGGSGMNDDGLG